MTDRWPVGRDRWVLVLLLTLALISTGRALTNGFAFDDVPIIVENSQVKHLAPPWEYATQSYWPPLNLGDAYRPWTIWWLAIEWAVGGGSPIVFHAVNLLLFAATTVLIYRLAGRLLPPLGAAVAAALFAVHPVHVEATANVVGQAELWMTGFVLAGALVYLDARRRGPLTTKPRRVLGVLLVLAAASKEQGIILPGLLLLLELATGSGSLRARLKELAPTYLFLGIVGAAFLLGRWTVLGDLGGGTPAMGLTDLRFRERAIVMLPMALDWVRLLVWPAHLRAQYSPPEFAGTAGWTGAAWGGLLLLLGIGILALAARRRLPVLTLGIAWIGLAGSIVSNLPFPTGILIAERTLFLPSVGLVLAAGALTSLIPAGVALSAAVLLVILGGARSWSRQPVWRDNQTLFAQTVIDAPRGYRSFYVAGKEHQRGGNDSLAIAMYRRAAELYQGDVRVFEEWGQVLRTERRCAEAIPVLQRGVRVNPTSTLARSRLFECLLEVGRRDEARQVAQAGIALGRDEFKSSLARLEKSPPGS